MQLFHHLKQKFPDLRDNDVNESIQKYGLDRERCEEELSQRTQVHPGGYYGPWGRSSPASSRLTSPVRGSTPSTPTTPLLVNTSPGVLGGEYLVYSGGGAAPLFTSPPATSSPALHPSSAGSLVSYGWNPTVANGYRPAPRQPQDGPARLGDRDRSKSRSGTPVAPSSAPVVPNSFDPFSRESPERRRSADNHHHHHHHLPEARYSPPPARPAMDPPAGLAATATATTTFTTTTTNTTTFATLITTTATPTTTITTTTSTTINCTNLSPVDGGSNSSSSSSGSGGGGSRSSGRPPPVLVQDQLARKQRMAMELSKQVEEKDRLEAEVEMMLRELQAREQQRKLNADTNTMRIEEVQQENQRLQSECYEMENRILRLAPDFDLEGYSTLTQPQPGYSEGMPPVSQPPLLTRGSSGSSLGSELGTPNTPNTPHTPGYLPTRPAPPPPAPPPPPLTNHGYGQYQGRGGERMEEASHKWGCSKCTFINHPDMNMCEMCDFPRFTIGSQEYRGWAMV